MKELKLTLRAARVNAGYSQAEAAKELNKSIDTIGKYEADSSNIPRSLMEDFCRLYHIHPDNIFFGVESDFIGLKQN